MRSNLFYKDKEIIKSYTVNWELRHYYEAYFQDYIDFVKSIGYLVPRTEWYLLESELIITQELIISTAAPNYSEVLEKLLNFKLFNGYWGLDANPLNFIGDSSWVNFIDFNPLLYNEKDLLKLQFNYAHELAYARYFIQANIVSTFLTRMNLHDSDTAKTLLSQTKGYLYDNYNKILPREKLRLLACLTKRYPRGIDSYSEFYKLTKTYTELSMDTEKSLKSYLLN